MQEKILRAIEDEFRACNRRYFSYAWREKVEKELRTESRYDCLSQWLEEEIELRKSIIGIFSPADRESGYAEELLHTYLEGVRDLAVLIHMREIILDRRCTTEMREKIEFTICKMFGVKYSEELGIYLAEGIKNV